MNDMAVYVDALMNCIPSPRWRFKESCHLIADTEEELHEFAQRLGLKRGWFQSKSSLPHYDLTRNKRAEAVRLGAVEINRRELVAHIRRHRLTKE